MAVGTYLNIESVQEVHVEMTSYCNALCPQCSRTVYGIPNPNMPLGELTIEDITGVFSTPFMNGLSNVYFCGVHGDPSASNTTIPTVEHLRRGGVKRLSVFSNGSARDHVWWSDLGKLLNRPSDRGVFSIDGLEDTNSLYRRRTQWSRIMENAIAFIEAGGHARWDFLVFRHNEHQVEQARVLSKRLGFKEFQPKRSSRFYKVHNGTQTDGYPVFETKKLKPDEPIPLDSEADYLLYPATDSQWANKEVTDRLPAILQKYGDFNRYVAETPIRCRTQESRAIYLSFEGEVWPCCWTANYKFLYMNPDYRKELWSKVIHQYGEGFNNIRKNSLEEILRHPWFNCDLMNSWSSSLNSAEHPRLSVCGKQCGTEFNPYDSQHSLRDTNCKESSPGTR